MQWTVTQTSAAGQWTGTVVGDKPQGGWPGVLISTTSVFLTRAEMPHILIVIEDLIVDVFIFEAGQVPWWKMRDRVARMSDAVHWNAPGEFVVEGGRKVQISHTG